MFSKSEKSTPQNAGPVTSEPSARGPKGSPKPTNVPSIVSQDMRVIGSLNSDGEIQIDGQVEGDISAKFVTISPDALIEGSITAETVHVSGTVSGQIDATSVVIAKQAKIKGDVLHQTIAIESGAYIEGFCRPRGTNGTVVESAPTKASQPTTLRPKPLKTAVKATQTPQNTGDKDLLAEGAPFVKVADLKSAAADSTPESVAARLTSRN